MCRHIREVELKPGEVLISSGVGKLFEVSSCVIVVCSRSDLRGVQAYCVEIRRQLFAKTVRNCCFFIAVNILLHRLAVTALMQHVSWALGGTIFRPVKYCFSNN